MAENGICAFGGRRGIVPRDCKWDHLVADILEFFINLQLSKISLILLICIPIAYYMNKGAFIRVSLGIGLCRRTQVDIVLTSANADPNDASMNAP